ncbi:MAG: Uma2 family endonuclease [Armatimonadetes bacterium]|nr:Uma2 family endonuclease [Armatimonadota bacterium]
MAVTLTRPTQADPRPQRGPDRAPPLNNGDRLSRAEFLRRYEGHPEIATAELIEGSVYVASPVRFLDHGAPHAALGWWAQSYVAATLGVTCAVGTTVRLDNENVPQPDVLLRIEPARGGNSRVLHDGYLEGPPELVVEVAASTVSYDMHQKLRVYQRSGVREYVVAQVYDRRVDWFILRDSVYEALSPDEGGILRSEVFPGLWLKADAFWERDLAGMLAVLQEGLSSAEHAAFVERLTTEASPA